MKIQKVHRISSIQKMKNNPHYHLAKTGDCVSAELLVNQIVQSPSCFQNLTGFVCPVQKPAGNQIPVALAKLMCSHSKLTLFDSVFLQHTSHGSSMVERLYYHPYFSGKVIPGNYIIVDDVYTTRITTIATRAWKRIGHIPQPNKSIDGISNAPVPVQPCSIFEFSNDCFIGLFK